MKENIAVIGLGILGREITITLSERGYSVLAIDKNSERVDQIKTYTDRAVIVDSTDEIALERLNINEIDIAISTIGESNLESSILTTALLKQFNVPRIIVKAFNPLNTKILRLVGATEIINPEKEMGVKLANIISKPGILDIIPISKDYSVSEIIVPESFIGRLMYELDIRKKYGVNVIGIRRNNLPSDDEYSKLIMSPGPDFKFISNDVIIVVGQEKDIDRINYLG